MISHSSDVDSAMVALLAADDLLTALLPDGVFIDSAPFGSTAFAIVSLLDHVDTYVLHGLAFERFLYLVKAVCQDGMTSAFGVSADTVELAERRIYELLQDAHEANRVNLPPLAPGFYRVALVQRTQYVRYMDLDEEVDQRWLHRGGHYEVLVAPTV